MALPSSHLFQKALKGGQLKILATSRMCPRWSQNAHHLTTQFWDVLGFILSIPPTSKKSSTKKSGQNPHHFLVVKILSKSPWILYDFMVNKILSWSHRQEMPPTQTPKKARLSIFQRQQSGAAFSIGSSKQSHTPQLQPAGEDHLGMGQNPGTVRWNPSHSWVKMDVNNPL